MINYNLSKILLSDTTIALIPKSLKTIIYLIKKQYTILIIELNVSSLNDKFLSYNDVNY